MNLLLSSGGNSSLSEEKIIELNTHINKLFKE